MKIEFAGMTQKGGRPLNEDSYIMLNHGNNYCFAVADGLGGHGKGDIASSTVAETVEKIFDAKSGTQADKLNVYFEESQRAVLQKQKETNSVGAMKTTLSVLSIEDGWALWGHIGDSRIYCFRNHRFFWRTLDHSVPQMLVAIGEIKEKDIRHHEDRNRLLKVIGTEWEKPEYEIAQKPFRPRPNDKFLLCSDGFWENIEDSEMIDCSRKAKNATEWLNEMKRIVIAKGRGKENDNFTAITVWFK